jgi:hypothetical protein
MRFGDFEVRKEKGTGDILANVFTSELTRYEKTDADYHLLNQLYVALVGHDTDEKEDILLEWLNSQNVKEYQENLSQATTPTPIQTDPADLIKKGITGLMKFFSEFNFQPNFRFLNTLSRYGEKEGKGYIARYFELINSPYYAVIQEKMKSAEFTKICKDFFIQQTTKQINTRFKLYYGSQGTGKTTIALQESHNECMVCHNAMLPSDLMENFNFSEGKAEFQPSALYNAMVNGTPIVLDEINLLPFESLRFLQGILDGKQCFQYKDKTVQIQEGFMIIGTMNLTVNGMTFGLPEPLVDRCAETRKFELTSDNLLGAVL